MTNIKKFVELDEPQYIERWRGNIVNEIIIYLPIDY